MCYTGNYGNTKYWKLEGAINNHTSYSFTTCSARLPVYAIIIALVIPDTYVLGFNLQGLTLMLLYLIGFAMAIFSAYILNIIQK
jgi:Fe2+ transport system protein B